MVAHHEIKIHPHQDARDQAWRVFVEANRPANMPDSVAGAFDHPSQRQDHPCAPAKIVQNDAGDYDHEIRGIEPEKLGPGIFRLPVLAHLFHEAAAQQGFVDAMYDVGSHGEPKREKQRHAHWIGLSFYVPSGTPRKYPLEPVGT